MKYYLIGMFTLLVGLRCVNGQDDGPTDPNPPPDQPPTEQPAPDPNPAPDQPPPDDGGQTP